MLHQWYICKINVKGLNMLCRIVLIHCQRADLNATCNNNCHVNHAKTCLYIRDPLASLEDFRADFKHAGKAISVPPP